jgi:sialate O-acetylesterase
VAFTVREKIVFIICIIPGLLMVAPLDAKVRLPSIIGDNMVLQQQAGAPVWGKAAPGRKVTVRASWGGKASVTAKSDSSWMVRLSTPTAGGPYSITISDGQPVTLKNVLVGEVWLCTGQSNMAMPMQGFRNKPVEGAMNTILSATPDTPIRMARVQRGGSLEPKWDSGVDGWNFNTPPVVSRTSATAYYFGKNLYDHLHVPIGLIIADWGGTAIEYWMSEETLRALGFDLSDLEELFKKKPKLTPTALYNAMLAPLAPYAVKGFIWYQGENNRPGNQPGKIYSELQTAYARMLRRCFGDGSDSQPFYFVQIAPYNYDDPDGLDSGYMYEQQARTLELLPNSGMVVTNDIGDAMDIHPLRKSEVGLRLSLLALQRNYGLWEDLDCKYPMYSSVSLNGDSAIVTFDVGPGGLCPYDQNVIGFEVAGEDRVFHPAEAVQKGLDKVVVKCDEVSDIKAVRYCFHNCQVGSLTNILGLPACPFRTDNW